jgi:hypothetical protein
MHYIKKGGCMDEKKKDTLFETHFVNSKLKTQKRKGCQARVSKMSFATRSVTVRKTQNWKLNKKKG